MVRSGRALEGMIASGRLAEHENRGEATVMILHERVRVLAVSRGKALGGDLLIIPDRRHSLQALKIRLSD